MMGRYAASLAIELSKKSWIVAVNTPLSDKVSRHTLEACDWKGLLELIARIRTRVMALIDQWRSSRATRRAMMGSGCIACSKLMVCHRSGERTGGSTSAASEDG